MGDFNLFIGVGLLTIISCLYFILKPILFRLVKSYNKSAIISMTVVTIISLQSLLILDLFKSCYVFLCVLIAEIIYGIDSNYINYDKFESNDKNYPGYKLEDKIYIYLDENSLTYRGILRSLRLYSAVISVIPVFIVYNFITRNEVISSLTMLTVLAFCYLYSKRILNCKASKERHRDFCRQ